MKTKCKCGKKISENYYRMDGEMFCSECYKEMKFLNSTLGYALFHFFYLSVGLIFLISIMIPLFALGIRLLFGRFNHDPIFFPHIIATFLLLILGIFFFTEEINSKKIRIIPSQLIKKMFSIKCFQYLIIYLYHLYVYSFFVRMCAFSDGVENTEIFGLHFNITIANLLMYASLISLISIQVRNYNSSITKRNNNSI